MLPWTDGRATSGPLESAIHPARQRLVLSIRPGRGSNALPPCVAVSGVSEVVSDPGLAKDLQVGSAMLISRRGDNGAAGQPGAGELFFAAFCAAIGVRQESQSVVVTFTGYARRPSGWDSPATNRRPRAR